MEVKIPHRACGVGLDVDVRSGGHPDACPDCGAVVSGDEVLADAAEVLTEDEREREQQLRHDDLVQRRQQTLPH